MKKIEQIQKNKDLIVFGYKANPMINKRFYFLYNEEYYIYHNSVNAAYKSLRSKLFTYWRWNGKTII